jgi:hemolysin III
MLIYGQIQIIHGYSLKESWKINHRAGSKLSPSFATKTTIRCLKGMEQYTQTMGEEIANSALHGIGCLLGIAGLVFLITHVQHPLPAVIFASAMILMFLASSVYHAVIPQKIKNFFRIIDHQAIYIFIAGTYTPYCLLALRGPLGWTLLGFEWVLALTGVILSALKFRLIKKVEMVLFILMGWAIIVGCVPLARSITLQSFILLFAGGLAYTAGIFWYRAGKEKTDGAASGQVIRKRLFGAHVVWHLFVLAGAACHWFSVWYLFHTAV